MRILLTVILTLLGPAAWADLSLKLGDGDLASRAPLEKAVLLADPAVAEGNAALQSALRRAEDGDWAMALKDVKRGLSMAPEHAGLLHYGAIIGIRMADYPFAEACLEPLQRARSHDVGILVRAASVKLLLGKEREAEELLTRAEWENPDYLGVRMLRLWTDLKGHRMSPEDDYWLRRPLEEQAVVANWLRTYDEFLSGFLPQGGLDRVASITLGVESAEALSRLGDLFEQLRDAMGQEDWKRIGEIASAMKKCGLRGLSVDLVEADMYVKTGDNERGLRNLKMILNSFPREQRAWYRYGYVLLDTGRYKEAADAFSSGLKVEPDSSLLQFALAAAYAMQDRMDDALDLLEQVAAKEPEALAEWTKGEAPYLEKLRGDKRFRALEASLKSGS